MFLSITADFQNGLEYIEYIYIYMYVYIFWGGDLKMGTVPFRPHTGEILNMKI